MRHLIRSLLGRSTDTAFPAIAPTEPLFVVGDVHGCAALLTDLLEKAPADARIICVGDIIDRGEHSKAALDTLMRRDDIICLRGNHEDMLLAFLDKPEGRAARWLDFGGLQTLASFGVAKTTRKEQRDALHDALGAARIGWLRSRPSVFESGNVAVVHAGADPQQPIGSQSRGTLVWGHPAFGVQPRSDGIWVVHGHTIVPEPVARDGVISVDTGAYATNRLTAAYLTAGECRFIQVSAGA